MRRSKWEIYRDILRCSLKGEVKTRVMYATGLPYSHKYFGFKDYLTLLIGKGMIQLEGKKYRSLLRTTAKGRIFLAKLDDIIKFWEDVVNRSCASS